MRDKRRLLWLRFWMTRFKAFVEVNLEQEGAPQLGIANLVDTGIGDSNPTRSCCCRGARGGGGDDLQDEGPREKLTSPPTVCTRRAPRMVPDHLRVPAGTLEPAWHI